MGFAVYRNASRDRLVGDFATLDDALTALAKGNLLVLPAGAVLPASVPLDVDVLTLDVRTDGLVVATGAAVTRLDLVGDHAATVDTGALGPLASIRVEGSNAGLTLLGGAARDMATGGSAMDVLRGGAGDDVLTGLGGNDVLDAGAGRDRLYGGNGHDLLLAGEGSRATLEGGAGADTFVLGDGAPGTAIIADFDPGQGDRLVIEGLGGYDDLVAAGAISQGTDQTVIRWGGLQVQLVGTDPAELDATSVSGGPVAFASFDDFLASGLAGTVDEITIAGVTWKMRDAQPLHEGYKGQDAQGHWWSPDYLVVVAAGQSNMTGAGRDGDMTLSGDVVAWDWVNGELIPASYASAPANGPGVRTGSTLFNNLYFPFAEDLAASAGQPVLVIAHPVSGSQIESWVGPADANWDSLEADIVSALGAVGQDAVDAFLWLQGESDYPDKTAYYQTQVLALIDQVRTAGWGGSEVAMLMGELSREGVNQAQNAALQAIELSETDPFLAFVSSTGLTATSPDGVHYDGASLVEYGHRYAAAYEAMLAGTPLPPNTAPTVAAGAPIPTEIVVTEGEVLSLDLSQWFADAEGDELWYYGTLSKRGVYLIDPVDGGVEIEPGFDHAGTYTLSLYANDYLLDGPRVTVTLRVIDANPGVAIYGNKDFGTLHDRTATFAEAMVGLPNSRGVDILLQDALSTGTNLVTSDSLTIRGGSGISGELTMADGILRLWLDGAARLDVRANLGDNYVQTNNAFNTVVGRDGNDRLYGQDGDDHLMGDKGNDSLYGGDGADRLVGSVGADHAYGGNGADAFVFEAGGGDLRLRDWQDGIDRIEVEDFGGVSSFSQLMSTARLVQSSSSVTLTIGTDRLIVDGATVAQLTADDFIFT